jgi:hypothetical protein
MYRAGFNVKKKTIDEFIKERYVVMDKNKWEIYCHR